MAAKETKVSSRYLWSIMATLPHSKIMKFFLPLEILLLKCGLFFPLEILVYLLIVYLFGAIFIFFIPSAMP